MTDEEAHATAPGGLAPSSAHAGTPQWWGQKIKLCVRGPLRTLHCGRVVSTAVRDGGQLAWGSRGWERSRRVAVRREPSSRPGDLRRGGSGAPSTHSGPASATPRGACPPGHWVTSFPSVSRRIPPGLSADARRVASSAAPTSLPSVTAFPWAHRVRSACPSVPAGSHAAQDRVQCLCSPPRSQSPERCREPTLGTGKVR